MQNFKKCELFKNFTTRSYVRGGAIVKKHRDSKKTFENGMFSSGDKVMVNYNKDYRPKIICQIFVTFQYRLTEKFCATKLIILELKLKQL